MTTMIVENSAADYWNYTANAVDAVKAARAARQVAAADRRATQEREQDVRRSVIAEETALIDRRVAAARLALGVAPGDPNPSSICLMIEMLMSEMRIRLSEKGFW